MSFLAPLFLLGGLAVALPVVFHLVRRSSREQQLFSSLMFLETTPPRLTRRNRLEHIFLLLLRCLTIGLLAFAFARPFLQKPVAAAPVSSAGAQMVLLVDTSASMKREGVWPATLDKVEAALKASSPADQVALLTFDAQVRTVVSFDQWSAMNLSERAALAFQRLKETRPSWYSTHLGNALIAAAETIQDANKREEHPGPRRIVLITDMQEGARLDGLQGHDWPRGLEVVVAPAEARRPTNAGLQWVMDADDSAWTPTDTVRIRVSNSANAGREQFQVRWSGLPDAPSLDAYVPPGQSRLMSAPATPTNRAVAQITLTGDDDDFDNRAYVVQPKPEEVNVLFWGESAAGDPDQLLYYLNRAFQDTRRQVVRLGSSAGNLSTNQLVIIPGSLPENQTDSVHRYLTNGGTALFVMNDARIAQTLGQLTGTPDFSAREASVANYAMFGQMDFTHPLLAPFTDPRFGDFTKIRFWKHRTLSAHQLPGARIIARYDDNDPAILQVPVGRGHAFVFTFSWRPSDSQFALSSKFVPLLYSLLDQAGGASKQPTRFRVGDPVDLSTVVSKSGGARLSVRTPDGASVQLAAGESRFTNTDQPGIYEIFGGTTSTKFAVNLDPVESKTAPMPAEELERLGVPMKSTELSPALQAARRETLHNADLEARQKLWRWLIVAALAVLLMETWLAGWITRRAAAPFEAAT